MESKYEIEVSGCGVISSYGANDKKVWFSTGTPYAMPFGVTVKKDDRVIFSLKLNKTGSYLFKPHDEVEIEYGMVGGVRYET